MFCQCLCEVYTCCIDILPTSPGQNFIIELSLSALKQDFCETVRQPQIWISPPLHEGSQKACAKQLQNTHWKIRFKCDC